MVNKKVVILVSILSIVITGAIVYFSLKPLLNIKYSFGDEEYESKTSIIGNKTQENIVENKNEIEDETNIEVEENNTSETNKISEKENNNTTPTSDSKKTGKELALELAKKEWGENDISVYYYIEEKKSEDVYIISVRNRETTAGMIDYEVNIKTGKVEEY